MKTLQSPYIVIPFWGAVAGAMLAGTGPFWLAAIGLGVWPLVEYSAHRWGMHALERRWPRFYKRAHGVHHRYPGDLSHFTIPIPVVLVVVVVLALALHVAGVGLVALGGLLVGYVLYDLAHLAAHGLIPFPFRRALVRHHARHHANQACNFGVSAPWIERLFGTRAP